MSLRRSPKHKFFLPYPAAWEEYYYIDEQTIFIRKQEFKVSTKRGSSISDLSRQSTQLLDLGFSSPIQSNSHHKILLFGIGNGFLVLYFSHLFPNSMIWGTDLTYTSLELCKNTVRLNQLHNVFIFPELSNPSSYLDEPTEDFDIAVIQLPKGRTITRRWLVQVHKLLHPQGILYLLGSNNEGIQSVAKDASELFGNLKLLGYKNKGRIYQYKKLPTSEDQPEWVNQPGIAPDSWNQINVEGPGYQESFRTLPGVFSYDHLDPGTELLLENLNITPSSLVLDMGCGCGIIGIFAALQGARAVHMADDNLYAVSSTLENIHLHNVATSHVFPSDLYSNLQPYTYDAILSNPPFHTGTAIDYQVANVLIAQGFRKLNPGGSLTIVANKFLPYHKNMLETFNNVIILQETSKFHVLRSYRET